MTTPIAVFTNLAYIACGIVVMRGRPHVDAIIRNTYPFRVPKHTLIRTLSSWLVGLAFLTLGVGSAWFHWLYDPVLNNWPVQAQLADERGMYIAFAVLMGVLWRHTTHPRYGIEFRRSVFFGHWVWPNLPWLGLSLGIVLAIFAAQSWVDSMLLIPALVLLCLGAVWASHGWRKAAWFTTGLVAIVITRAMGEPNGVFGPQDKFTYDFLHGTWHTVTAFYMWKLWKTTEQHELREQ